MSELIDVIDISRNYRWSLLATASAIAIGSMLLPIDHAVADNIGTEPTVWIDLGGQLERVDEGQQIFAPAFFDSITNGGFTSPLRFERSARYSNGLEGSIVFLPSGSDWIISASVRYGRSSGHRFQHQQHPALVSKFQLGGTRYRTAPPAYAQTKSDNAERHLIADFQVGRDVGLGLFGKSNSSSISLGVRVAQFTTSNNVTVNARPNVQFQFVSILGYQVPQSIFHEYFASAVRHASFQGVGPSLSWKSAMPVFGNPDSAQVALNWGVNASVLFGRQKAQNHHSEYGRNRYLEGKYPVTAPTLQHSHARTDNRSVVVPNLGGFLGVSFNYAQAKVGIGYRADFFFGAMDGGIDTHKSETTAFYGPFATISVGLGG